MSELPVKFKYIKFILCFFIVLICVFSAALYNGVIHINNPSKQKYPIRGVDVSSYQGVIDWNVLSRQNIDFAYIKATEGSSYVDPYFETNIDNAVKTDLYVGAYHFFSFESSGEAQANNIVSTVPKDIKMLPFVIDVEYYGGFRTKDDIDVSKVRTELRTLVDLLEKEYEIKPIIYVSADTYKTIINQDFDDCKIWYRSVYSKVPEDVSWIFWQYSNRHILKGYKGKERFIDMNVFYGTKENFEFLYTK